jgi:hypothetical protein
MSKASILALGKNANLMSKADLARNVLNSETLTDINNAYYVLKRLPGTNGLKLKIKI